MEYKLTLYNNDGFDLSTSRQMPIGTTIYQFLDEIEMLLYALRVQDLMYKYKELNSTIVLDNGVSARITSVFHNS